MYFAFKCLFYKQINDITIKAFVYILNIFLLLHFIQSGVQKFANFQVNFFGGNIFLCLNFMLFYTAAN